LEIVINNPRHKSKGYPNPEYHIRIVEVDNPDSRVISLITKYGKDKLIKEKEIFMNGVGTIVIGNNFCGTYRILRDGAQRIFTFTDFKLSRTLQYEISYDVGYDTKNLTKLFSGIVFK
jgi:hypothetical protein